MLDGNKRAACTECASLKWGVSPKCGIRRAGPQSRRGARLGAGPLFASTTVDPRDAAMVARPWAGMANPALTHDLTPGKCDASIVFDTGQMGSQRPISTPGKCEVSFVFGTLTSHLDDGQIRRWRRIWDCASTHDFDDGKFCVNAEYRRRAKSANWRRYTALREPMGGNLQATWVLSLGTDRGEWHRD
jgi:hypothetical protein